MEILFISTIGDLVVNSAILYFTCVQNIYSSLPIIHCHAVLLIVVYYAKICF